MTSVITGDIVNSRKAASQETWLPLLKEALLTLGGEKKYWGIFRGDSFQLEVTDIYNSFWHAVYLKACIKTLKGLDVRMAIGIGNKDIDAGSIAEANGTAFENSGEQFERLKTLKTNLAIKTLAPEIDGQLNASFKLALIAMDNWTVNSAEFVKKMIEHPTLSQQELGNLLGIKQNTVSERQKRSYISEITEFDQKVFRPILKNLKINKP